MCETWSKLEQMGDQFDLHLHIDGILIAIDPS